MLRTRLLVGSALAAALFGVLFVDDTFAPWYPFFFALILAAGLLSVVELVGLIPEARRPPLVLCLAGVLFVLAANWLPVLHDWSPGLIPWIDPWRAILGVIVAVLLLGLLREMAVYRGPGEAVARVCLAVFAVVYLGVLASLLVQLRWLPARDGDPARATHALMLTIFVPKCCDIGAYCTGRLFGRHRMTPNLSPKKTWEGAAGGIGLAIAAALFGAWLGGRPEGWPVKAAAFGIVVGAAGMLGDLAESLIKREGQKKDASQSVPGFGGVLDVVDSLLFAAPVAYFWLTTERITPL